MNKKWFVIVGILFAVIAIVLVGSVVCLENSPKTVKEANTADEAVEEIEGEETVLDTETKEEQSSDMSKDTEVIKNTGKTSSGLPSYAENFTPSNNSELDNDDSEERDVELVDAEQLLLEHPEYTVKYGYISSVNNQVVTFTDCPLLTIPYIPYAVGAQIPGSDGRIFTVSDFSKYVNAMFYSDDAKSYDMAKEYVKQGEEYIDNLCFEDENGDIFVAGSTIEGDSNIVINKYFISSIHQNLPGIKQYVLYPAYPDNEAYKQPYDYIGLKTQIRIADDALIYLETYGPDEAWDGIDMNKGTFIKYGEEYDIPVGIFLNKDNEIVYMCRRFFV